MEISRLWAAMLTRTRLDAGTDSSITLTINTGGVDRLNHTFARTTQRDQETGQANLYEVDVRGRGIDTDELTDSSIRVGILGRDAWRPEHFVVWGERSSPLLPTQIIPLAIETDITTQLSADRDEGPAGLPLRLVGRGRRRMPIRRLLMLLTTAGVPPKDDLIAEGVTSEGTNSPLEIQIVSDGRLVVLSEIRGTHQDDLELGGANFYSAPVIVPFTQDGLTEGSITLRVKGLNSWGPASLFLFGLDDASGRPESLVPLVHLPAWPFGILKADSTTGVASVALPVLSSSVDDGLLPAFNSIASSQERIVALLEQLVANGARETQPSQRRSGTKRR